LCLAVTGACAACGNSISTITAPTTSTTPVITDLTGRVVDAATSAPLTASVTLVDTSANALTATTDATGAFRFPSLASGTYSLQVTAAGYLTSTATLTFPVASYTVQMSKIGSAPVSTLRLDIAGPASVAVGRTAQFTAKVVYTDGTSKDVTNVAKWTSTVTTVATISTTGLVKAWTVGSTDIAATFQDVSGDVTIATTSP